MFGKYFDKLLELKVRTSSLWVTTPFKQISYHSPYPVLGEAKEGLGHTAGSGERCPEPHTLP